MHHPSGIRAHQRRADPASTTWAPSSLPHGTARVHLQPKNLTNNNPNHNHNHKRRARPAHRAPRVPHASPRCGHALPDPIPGLPRWRHGRQRRHQAILHQALLRPAFHFVRHGRPGPHQHHLQPDHRFPHLVLQASTSPSYSHPVRIHQFQARHLPVPDAAPRVAPGPSGTHDPLHGHQPTDPVRARSARAHAASHVHQGRHRGAHAPPGPVRHPAARTHQHLGLHRGAREPSPLRQARPRTVLRARHHDSAPRRSQAPLDAGHIAYARGGHGVLHSSAPSPPQRGPAQRGTPVGQGAHRSEVRTHTCTFTSDSGRSLSTVW